MKRVLMYASVASMIQQFNMENIRLLIEMGYEVDVACNMENGSTISKEKILAMKQELEQMNVRVFHVPVPRKVTAIADIVRALSQSCALMEENGYDLIHCHSPIGGMICRLANRFSKHYKTTRMIYTAHGFHFYKGAPKINWLLYYPVERICARFTDVLITINREDYALATRKMRAKEVVYVPGIGVDTRKFRGQGVDCEKKRNELGLTQDDFVILSVGELIDRKNHAVAVRALARMENEHVKYVVCGKGPNDEKLKRLAQELGVTDQLKLLGFRSDIAEIMQVADVYMFPSLQEGLPVALMEAMSAGKAVVCSTIRGNTDLIENGIGGYLVPAEDDREYAEKLAVLMQDAPLRKQMGQINLVAVEAYDRKVVSGMMKEIYGG